MIPLLVSGADTYTAIAKFQAKSGSQVEGHAVFTDDGLGLKMQIHAQGFLPYSRQFFQIHTRGNCDSFDARSAGGVYKPKGFGKNYGFGKLGSIRADQNGMIEKTILVNDISIQVDSPTSILGKALIVHSNQDSPLTRPVRMGSQRVACAVIH